MRVAAASCGSMLTGTVMAIFSEAGFPETGDWATGAVIATGVFVLVMLAAPTLGFGRKGGGAPAKESFKE